MPRGLPLTTGGGPDPDWVIAAASVEGAYSGWAHPRRLRRLRTALRGRRGVGHGQLLAADRAVARLRTHRERGARAGGQERRGRRRARRAEHLAKDARELLRRRPLQVRVLLIRRDQADVERRRRRHVVVGGVVGVVGVAGGRRRGNGGSFARRPREQRLKVRRHLQLGEDRHDGADLREVAQRVGVVARAVEHEVAADDGVEGDEGALLERPRQPLVHP